MSGNSVVGKIGQAAGDLVSAPIKAIGDLFSTPSAPSLQPSSAAADPTPTLAQTNTTALQNQLSKEKQVASTSTILTGGAGLLDDPTTTSKTLVGS